ncbi:ribosomal-processing cysteine protease Prp [Paenibacillus koleovorans]|uniref:ribosomal-processing cysteine protease Prp n=1 Tax=Paenibacillus koleovorans TaxID=121608 RepID=UPI000FDC4E69|nr:ribosomal-processing cysteine protease Prp [Paenibacillus koleovorans]
MIRVIIDRQADGRIAAFSVTGHAFYGEPGQDIVCAGVSAVTVGTVNAVETLTGVELPSRMDDGLLKVRVPDGVEQDTNAKIQLLLESMVVMLNTIQQEYGAYMQMQQSAQRKRR